MVLPLDGYRRPAGERWAGGAWLASGGFTGCEDAILLGVVSRVYVALDQVYFLAVFVHGVWCWGKFGGLEVWKVVWWFLAKESLGAWVNI